MFTQRQRYFTQLSRSYPILKLVDIYDRQSFVRAYVLDNVYVCVLMYVIFYVALWYAKSVITRIEKSNKEMLMVVKENRTKLDDVKLLKNKKAEYEEVVIKAKEAQKATSKHLENEMQRLSTELISTTSKLTELEKIIEKYKSPRKFVEIPAGDVADRETTERPEGFEGPSASVEDFKILEPSFPPPVPPEPPPRKYGIFVTRPPGQRCASSAAAPATAAPKIGFKYEYENLQPLGIPGRRR